MLDQLLDIFERDRRSSASPKGGLRGTFGSLFDSEPDDAYASSRDRDHRRSERQWDDDRYDDDDRYAPRARRRERDFFDFGD